MRIYYDPRIKLEILHVININHVILKLFNESRKLSNV